MPYKSTEQIVLGRRKFIQFSATSLLAARVLNSNSLLAAGATAAHPTNLLSLQEAIQKLEAMTGTETAGWKWRPADVPHPEDPALDDSSWAAYPYASPRPFFGGTNVGEGAVWFRAAVEVPQKMGGYNIQGLPVRLNLTVTGSTPGPIRVFSNSSMVQMASPDAAQSILLMPRAKAGQKSLIAVYSPGPSAVGGRLEVEYPLGKSNPALTRQEILAVQATGEGFQEGKAQRDSQLCAAADAIDFAALDRGDQEAFDHSLEAADRRMRPLAGWIRQFTIRAVGNSHIDLAWMWPWTETVEVVRDTFHTALELLDEYPGLFYAQSSAQTFLWLERYYPGEFQAIQKRVKDGRWELVGGMWCEPDLNMPCGESLVRQILTGKRYFQQKFGVDVKIGWNPDSFGFSWQLPQIYKRSGVDCFVTQKISVNDTTRFPYKLFQWESPDGSRVLTYFPHGYGNDIDAVECSGFIAEDTPLCSGFKEQMLLFGLGDHGGGPTRQMLDAAVRWQKSPQAALPKFRFSTAQEFFNDVEASLPNLNLPVWKDELYFQYHRGTYTTQAESKKQMRASEVLLLDTEKFSSLAMLYGREYPQAKFQDAWRRVCFEQFHDIAAGSGIHVNYEDEAENLEFVRNSCLPELQGSLAGIAERVNTQGAGIPFIVFNSLSWERTDIAEVEAQFPSPLRKFEVRDSEGNVVPSSEISCQETTHTPGNINRLFDVPDARCG